MAAEALAFEEWAGSGRGLLSRPTTPGNIIPTLADVLSMMFTVYNRADNSVVDTGPLVVAECMQATPQTWPKDGKGYTCLIQAPGSWWPDPGKYRVVISFTLTALAGGKSFLEVWEVTAKDPTGAGG